MKKQIRNVVVAVVLTAAAAPCAVQAMNAFELAKAGFSVKLPSRSELERRKKRKDVSRAKAAAKKTADTKKPVSRKKVGRKKRPCNGGCRK